MTSRPSLGVLQQRQPQRSTSGGVGLTQRPAGAQRSQSVQLTQPYDPPSASSSTAASTAAEANDAAVQGNARLSAVHQRMRGSLLRLEVSSDDPAGSGSRASSSLAQSPAMLDADAVRLPLVQQPAEGDVPLPMPPRRQWSAAPVPRPRAPASAPPPPTQTMRKDARPKPYSVETPADAPRYVTNTNVKGNSEPRPGPGLHAAHNGPNNTGHGDFWPWTGDQAEDVFTKDIIVSGNFDNVKTHPVSNSESSSAKPVLWTQMKHKSGLGFLSTVFTAVLGHRRQKGQITAPSTFKPPPRVTLTDTRRELWLQELANSQTPLRRLSRSIPHGIRGKMLLEQCLNKNVPIDRAVWLAKCVGANEIRAFRRKGANGGFVMGGEVKWIRDWTASLEQFLESVMYAFGDNDWRAKVNYAIRLATHLYSEYLLDRIHYMEWMVANLENSSTAKLPMWMLVTQIYWKDLLQQRRFGKRVVLALIKSHDDVQKNADKDILQPLEARLGTLLRRLMLSCPENFIWPSEWSTYKDGLQACVLADDETQKAAFGGIGMRNEQLTTSSNRSQPASRHILVKMLDSTLQSPMADDLAARCWNIAKDKCVLVRALLEWCTCLHRPGPTKVYVASRFFKHWSTLGVDFTAAVLEFLDVEPLREADRRKALYQVVGELVRSDHFSVSRYVQWLISRGCVRCEGDVSPEGSAATRLLVELPIHCLSRSQRNVRLGILRGAGFSVESEEKDVDMAKRHIKHSLGLPLDPGDGLLHQRPMAIGKLAKLVGRSGQVLRTDVSCWLRDQLTATARAEGTAVFDSVRTILEAAEDFSMLADIVMCMTKTSNVEMLACCTDTVNRHVRIFAALGCSKPLFDVLHSRLQAVGQVQGIGARPLLASLVGLAPRLPGLDMLAAQLKRDLNQADRNHPVDACSPVSDNMAARLQMDDGDLHEEIEKLLASGTSLDKNTLERLFQTMVQRLQGCWGKDGEKRRAYAALLTRLRIFDVTLFDALMLKWLLYLRTQSSRPSILQLFPLLASLGCLSIWTMLATASADPTSASASVSAGMGGGAGAGPGAAGGMGMGMSMSTGRAGCPLHLTSKTRFMQEVLVVLTAPVRAQGLLLADEAYRFAILQDQAQRDHAKEMLALVRNALAEYAHARSQDDTSGLPLDDAATRDRLQSLLQQLVLKDAVAVARALVKTQDPHVSSCLETLTTRLLLPDAAPDARVSFEQVLGLTNEFTLPFCQVKLFLSLAPNTSEDTPSSGAAERQQSHVELFANAMDNAIDAKNITWTGMLSCFGPETTHHLRARAQTRFLELLPSCRSPAPAGGRSLDRSLQMADNLMAVIEAISHAPQAQAQAQAAPSAAGRPPQLLLPAMVDRLADLWELLTSSDPAVQSHKAAVRDHWLPLLLTFFTMHMPVPATDVSANANANATPAAKATQEARAKALVVLAGLLAELEVAPPQPAAMSLLTQRVFDIACVVADGLTDDSGRAACARVVRDGGLASDPRVRYLFSFAPEPHENLMLLMHAPQQQNQGQGQSPTQARGSGARAPAAAVAAAAAGGPLPGGGLLGTPLAYWGVADGSSGAGVGGGINRNEKLLPFHVRRWEVLSEPTPTVGENDTALSLALFEARKVL